MLSLDTILTRCAQRYLPAKTVAGVHVRVLSAQQYVYSLCVLRQDKQVVSILEQQTNVTDPETLFSYLSTSVPVYLSIEGKGVLIRSVTSGTTELSSLLQQVMPNARLEDFYAQSFPNDLVSVVRRTLVDDLIARFQAQGLYVLSAQAGPFALNTLLPFLDDVADTLILPKEQLSLQNQQIQAVTVSEAETFQAEYRVGEETVSAHLLLAYATALTHFMHHPTSESDAPTRGIAASLVAGEQEFYHRQFFTKAFPVTLAFFLIILLINTAFYFQAFEQNERLQTQAASDARLLTRLTQLEQEVATKQQFMTVLGWEQSVSLTSLADRLAATVPEQVVLSRLEIHPLDEAQHQKEKKQVFLGDQMRVAGTCYELSALNAWFRLLETSLWVAGLEEQQYVADLAHPGTGTFSFTLKLAR